MKRKYSLSAMATLKSAGEPSLKSLTIYVPCGPDTIHGKSSPHIVHTKGLPILDSVAQEHCKTYLVDVHCVTSIVINTDGYIRNLSMCLEFVNPPPPTMCPESEPILVASEGGTMFAEDASPIIITEQTCSTVTFQVVNIFEKSFTSYYVEYHNGGFGANECLQTENVGPRNFPRNMRRQSLQRAKGVNLMRTCAEFFALGFPSCCAVVGLQLGRAKIFDRGKAFDPFDSTRQEKFSLEQLQPSRNLSLDTT